MKKNKSRHPRIDLHGFKTDQVFDALDQFLLKASRQGAKRAEIICGKGEGLVRKKAVEYLKKAHYHWQFDQTPLGKPNEGALIVFVDE